MSDSGKLYGQLKLTNRLLESLVRLKLFEARGEKKQKEMILFLDALEFTPSEIAKYLGTTVNSVSPVISREKRKAIRKSK